MSEHGGSYIPIPDWALVIPEIGLGELLVLGVVLAEYRGRDHASVSIRGIAVRLGRERTNVRRWYRSLIRRRLLRVVRETSERYSIVRVVPPKGRSLTDPPESHRPRDATDPAESPAPHGVYPGVSQIPLKKEERASRSGTHLPSGNGALAAPDVESTW